VPTLAHQQEQVPGQPRLQGTCNHTAKRTKGIIVFSFILAKTMEVHQP
jgi:hypothetical protein